MRSVKRVLFSTLLFSVCLSYFGCTQQARTFYDPSADGAKQIDAAIEKIGGRDQLILVQVGGDWCKWCVRLNKTISEDPELLKALEEDFEWVHIYYGKENKNEEAMQRLNNPTGYGFPVFVMLDNFGVVPRVVPTGQFEDGDGYDKAKLLHFFQTHETPEDISEN